MDLPLCGEVTSHFNLEPRVVLEAVSCVGLEVFIDPKEGLLYRLLFIVSCTKFLGK